MTPAGGTGTPPAEVSGGEGAPRAVDSPSIGLIRWPVKKRVQRLLRAPRNFLAAPRVPLLSRAHGRDPRRRSACLGTSAAPALGQGERSRPTWGGRGAHSFFCAVGAATQGGGAGAGARAWIRILPSPHGVLECLHGTIKKVRFHRRSERL